MWPYYLVPYEGPVGREIVDFPTFLVARVNLVESFSFDAFESNLVRPLVSRQVLGHLVLASLVPDQLHGAMDPDIHQIKVGTIVLWDNKNIRSLIARATTSITIRS